MKTAYRASSRCRKTRTAEIQSGTPNGSTSHPSPFPYSLSAPQPACKTQRICPMEQYNLANIAALPPFDCPRISLKKRARTGTIGVGAGTPGFLADAGPEGVEPVRGEVLGEHPRSCPVLFWYFHLLLKCHTITSACLRILSNFQTLPAEKGTKIRGWARNDEEAAMVETAMKPRPPAGGPGQVPVLRPAFVHLVFGPRLEDKVPATVRGSASPEGCGRRRGPAFLTVRRSCHQHSVFLSLTPWIFVPAGGFRILDIGRHWRGL